MIIHTISTVKWEKLLLFNEYSKMTVDFVAYDQ